VPIIPVRNLSQQGIIRDAHPPALPLTAWSGGRNVIFANGKAMRSPIWRLIKNGTQGTSTSPVQHCATLPATSGFDTLVLARADGSLALYASGVITEASEVGFTPRSTTDAPWTSCVLGDVFYINRPDAPPRALIPGTTQFIELPNWPNGWRTNVIRQFQDTIMALGITQGAASIPSQVNVSDIAFFGQVPDSWDTTDPTKLAYSNDLAQIDGPILDGLRLSDRFLFYTRTQVWEMTATGSFNYAFRLLFSNAGIINTNCVVEKDGLHYVFGSLDCYATDGTSIKRLGEGRIREWFYRTMQKGFIKRNFVALLPETNEVMFSHVSGDPDTAWKNPTGCNAAWNYNITSDTWAPVDLPNVSSMTLCSVDAVYTWAGATGLTWATMGGSWYDQATGNGARRALAVNNPLSDPASIGVVEGTGRVLGYDFVDRGQMAFAQDPSCDAPSYLQRTGIDLAGPDGGQSPIGITKVLRGVYPEVTVSRPLTLTVDFSGSMAMSAPIVWEQSMTFDPLVDDKVDSRESARFLAIRFTFQPDADTEISAFDLDVVANGSR
jgi:hypothetical protein